MKSIKVKMMALMLVMVMVFTGCAQEQSSIKINANGTATIRNTANVEKEAADSAVSKYKMLMKSQGLTDKELEELSTEELLQGIFGAKEVKITTMDGKQYYTVTMFQNIKKDELSNIFMVEDPNSYVTTDIVYATVDYSSQLKNMEDFEEFSVGMALLGLDMDLSKISVDMEIEMPANIVSTTGKIDSVNKKKASYSFTLDKKATIFVTTKKGMTLEKFKRDVKKSNKIGKTKIKKLKADKVKRNAKKATVSLKYNRVKGAKGYQIEYATKKNFKGKKSITTKKTSYKIKKLKKGKKYYVRVRAYKNNMIGNPVYSKWVKKSVKTKK